MSPLKAVNIDYSNEISPSKLKVARAFRKNDRLSAKFTVDLAT
jgi:hypothetical protein